MAADLSSALLDSDLIMLERCCAKRKKSCLLGLQRLRLDSFDFPTITLAAVLSALSLLRVLTLMDLLHFRAKLSLQA